LTVPADHLRAAIHGEVAAVLCVLARGRARAITGEHLAGLVADRIREGGRACGWSLRTLTRRCQEAVQALIERGEPIASSSEPPRGYFWAESPEELEESLAESDRRARMALRRRGLLRQRIREMRGQLRAAVEGCSR
jgi:hypothetical protein